MAKTKEEETPVRVKEDGRYEKEFEGDKEEDDGNYEYTPYRNEVKDNEDEKEDKEDVDRVKDNDDTAEDSNIRRTKALFPVCTLYV